VSSSGSMDTKFSSLTSVNCVLSAEAIGSVTVLMLRSWHGTHEWILAYYGRSLTEVLPCKSH
jgi:hypothetical protein